MNQADNVVNKIMNKMFTIACSIAVVITVFTYEIIALSLNYITYSY